MEAQSEHNSNLQLSQKTQSCLPDHLVRTTREFVKQFNELERFKMANEHVQQALRYKQPRFDIINSLEPRFYKKVYFIQTSRAWEMLMIFLSFMHMYIIIFQNTSLDSLYHIASPVIYGVYLLDFIMQTYHESYDFVAHKARFATLFMVKIFILLLLGVDQVFVAISLTAEGRAIHPFRIIRVVMPVVYNRQLRRLFQALGSAWKNIVITFIFIGVIVTFFSIVMKEVISVPDDLTLDDYRCNYRRLDRMFFITYILGTYDSYPDNQLPAIEQNNLYYAMFILYIFLNMFIFSSIPGSLIFESFKETRGKKQLLDETKMQTSLIVAYITLGEENYQMDVQKMIKFLLHFYEKRIRFVDTITDLLLKLNTNDHSSIHINEFMQLGRILQQNSNLRLPSFSDYASWIAFRKYVNEKFKLKDIIETTTYKLIVAILVIAAFANATFCIFTTDRGYEIVDQIFINIFFLELMVVIIAIGPQNYFNRLFSVTDFVLVMIGFILQFVALEYKQDSLIRMVRIYRANFIIDGLLSNRFWTIKSSVYEGIQNLILRTTVIFPILLKFIPLFAIIYYVLGVFSMEVLFTSSQITPSQDYGMYDEFSNFNTFFGTQLVMFQILTEAGWSMVAFDHSSRMPDKYGLVMIMFASFHIIITLILATLMKGMIWSAFMAVSKQYEINKQEKMAEEQQMDKNVKKHKQLDDIEILISKLDAMKLDTVVKREIYEMKMNSEMMDKLRKINKKKKLGRKSIKIEGINTFYRHFGVNQMILEEEEQNLGANTQNFLFEIIQKFTREKFNFQTQNIYSEHEYELKIKRICEQLTTNEVHQSILLSIKPHELLNKHIADKLQTPCNSKNKEGGPSVAFNHIFDMYILLGSHPTWKEQKKLVLQRLIEKEVITKEEFGQFLHKKLGKKHFGLDQDCTIRRTYMQGTNPKLIEKFQAEYFENIYGKAFKEINKVTIEPLIKLQAKVIYGLKNICRYPHMGNTQFFKILSKLQNIISNQLLKAGSLFKMVFELNSNQNLWFSFHIDANEVPHLAFIKNGIWIYNETLVEHEIYHIKDLFKFKPGFKAGSLLERGELIKTLYETFETLALTLQDKEPFFESNPQYHVYDAYFMHIDVESIQRLIPKELQISKVMIVLLNKENERTNEDEIPFQVSEIPIEKFVPKIQFKFDETEGQTFKKLSNLASMPDEQISAREGLPFTYVLNFLQQVNDVLRLYCPNLIHYVEDLLNKEFKGP